MGIASWPLTVSSRRSTCHGFFLLCTNNAPCQSPTGSVSVFTVHERLTSCLIQASPGAYSFQPVVLTCLLVAHHKTGLEQGVDVPPITVLQRRRASGRTRDLLSSTAQPTHISEEPSYSCMRVKQGIRKVIYQACRRQRWVTTTCGTRVS